MSLKLTNKLTAQQKAVLQKLEYYGTYDLTIEEAAKLIDELFAAKAQADKNWTYEDMPAELKHITKEEF